MFDYAIKVVQFSVCIGRKRRKDVTRVLIPNSICTLTKKTSFTS